MSIQGDGQRSVHFPKSDSFEFDGEVASIFPDMAVRSIPLYREMHSLHARILVDDFRRWLQLGDGKYPYVVLDIGASRCHFYEEIKKWCSHENLPIDRIQYIAYDRSDGMLEETKRRNPEILYYKYDLADSSPAADFYFPMRADAVAMHYVMQFVNPTKRPFAFAKLGAVLRRRGLLFYSEKEKLGTDLDDTVTHIATEVSKAYYDFRRSNGYTNQEIAAKTAALKNSMWPVPAEETKSYLRSAGFVDFVPTCRMGEFHSFVAVKQQDF